MRCICEALLLQLVVKSPRFASREDVERFHSFVRALEEEPFAMGINTTKLWTRAFLVS